MATVGRPRLPKSARKRDMLALRLTDAERATVEASAKAKGLSVSDYIRSLLTVAEPVKPEPKRIFSTFDSPDASMKILQGIAQRDADVLKCVVDLCVKDAEVEPRKGA